MQNFKEFKTYILQSEELEEPKFFQCPCYHGLKKLYCFMARDPWNSIVYDQSVRSWVFRSSSGHVGGGASLEEAKKQARIIGHV